MRFIPAWAGNTRDNPYIGFINTVHPRVGGEHGNSEISFHTRNGSSPRGRGTQSPFAVGFTIHAVHPRVGGEHVEVRGDDDVLDGSSPRGRGTPHRTPSHATDDRFIPAWAGNTELRFEEA